MLDYIDPLYGKLSISEAELALFRTPELARLRDISLSAVPPLMLPWGRITSRFEHSVGVAHLAKIVAEKTEFASIGQDLIFAGLLHDVGSPPFSHLTEIFLEDKLGKTHELFAKEVLASGTVFDLIDKFHGHPQAVLKLISGEHEFGPLIAGTIDLDNLDNTLRFGLGAGLIKRLYEPESLAHSFGKSSTLHLRDSAARDISGWEFCREQVYSAVYSDVNLAPAAMLTRAIDLAFQAGDLTDEFFFRTDHQALYLLEHNCNSATRNLTLDARLWRHYPKAAELVTTTPPPVLKDWTTDKTHWFTIANQFAAKLDLSPQDVVVHIDKDKGHRRIDLPLVDSTGHTVSLHEPRTDLRFMVQVYLHPRHRRLHARAQQFLNTLLAA